MGEADQRSALADGWHVSIGGATHGPYDWPSVVGWARDGRIGPDDLLWHAQFPQWAPASSVPGLFPTVPQASRATARPVRRRMSGAMIATVIVIVLIIAAGAGVGTWLAVRGGGEAGNGAQGVAAGEIKTEKLSLAGTVVLPPGSRLSPTDLAVLSDTSETSCSSDGKFALDALHDEGARTPILVLNKARNPVLIAVADSNMADMQPSVASTARVLVLHDPAFLSLPKAAYDLAATRLETHPRLPALEAALATAITTDPSTPLDADAHPEIYNIAAEIAASLLSDIVEIDETAVGSWSAPQVLTATDLAAGAVPANSIRPVLRLAAANPTPFVEVIDDPEHSTPEVRLVNTTFAYYTVTCTLTTPQGTSTKTFFLPRCALWQLDLASLKIGLPPVGCRLEKLVDVGNGQLTFNVRRNDEYTEIDAAANTVTLLFGVGGESIRKMAGGGSDLAALGNTGAAILQTCKELGGLAGRLQGQTYAGAAKEVGAYFAVNGGRLLVAFWPIVQSEIKEEFFTVLGRVITRRMAAVAVLGYGSFDLICELMAMGNPAIASYDTAGVQVAGVYPFGATLKLSATPRDAQTYDFDALVSHLPGDFSQPLYLDIDFGDGNKETIQPESEGGFAPIHFTHTYSGTVPKTVRAVLRTGSGKPTIIASQEVDLTITATTTTTSTTTSTTTIQMNAFPTLDDLVGSYNDGVATCKDFHVDQAAYDQCDAVAAQGNLLAEGLKQALSKELSEELAQIGQGKPGPFSISKTGDGVGEIVVSGSTVSARGQYAFAYANGVITIDIELKDQGGKPACYVQGTINATFDKDRNVLIAGSFREEIDSEDIGPSSDGRGPSIVYFPRNSYYWVTQLTGSKPAFRS